MDWLDDDGIFPPKVDSSMSDSDHQANKFQESIPNTLIKEQCQLILDQNASVEDLTNAIEKCKELVLSTDECSTERKWLVRHLVELRFRLKEIDDANQTDQSKRSSMYKVFDIIVLMRVEIIYQLSSNVGPLDITDYSRPSFC